MATPSALATAAVNHLAASLPEGVSCELYAGEFSDGEVSRASVRAPAVLVACLSVRRKDLVETEEYDFVCHLAAYCMTRHHGGRGERFLAATGLAELVAAHLEGRRFGLTGLAPARVTAMDNLYAKALDRASVALMAVTWQQVIRMGEDVFAETGEVLDRVYAGWAPDIGTGHEHQYELVFPEDPDPTLFDGTWAYDGGIDHDGVCLPPEGM